MNNPIQKEYKTARKENNEWKIGEKVHVFPVKGKKYIRTYKSEIEKDNLGILPEF